MNTQTRLNVGSDSTKIVGSILASGNSRIGPIALEFENFGYGQNLGKLQNAGPAANSVSLTVKSYTGSGWEELIPAFTLTPGAKVIKTAVVHSKKIAVFGSGNTVVGLTIPLTQSQTMRGGTFDIELPGRTGFGFDADADSNQMFPPLPPEVP